MKLKLLGYGFLGWLIPFVVSFMIYPLKEKGLPLFETIMTLVLVIICIGISIMYFKGEKNNYLKKGFILGIVLLFVSLFIDLLMFMGGPMKMSLINYLKDIGFTYLIFPVITSGIGYLLDYKSSYQ